MQGEAHTVIDPELAGSASDETAETEQHVQDRKEQANLRAAPSPNGFLGNPIQLFPSHAMLEGNNC